MNTLNEKHFKALHYTAEGTDLTIELPETHLWVSGGSTNKEGFHLSQICQLKKYLR